MKKIILLILAVILGLLVVRFIIGGDEDTWICSGGQWVKHGNPSAAMPTGKCGK